MMSRNLTRLVEQILSQCAHSFGLLKIHSGHRKTFEIFRGISLDRPVSPGTMIDNEVFWL
jgi:hypothetical protein